MENKLFGDKNHFAIELENMKRHRMTIWGDCSLWLNGYRLHDYTGETCVNAVFDSIQFISKNNMESIASIKIPETIQEMYNLEEKRKEIGLRIFFPGIEGFDNFLKLYSKDSEHTVFLWALRPEPHIVNRSVYAGYPRGVQQIIIENREIQQIADKFKKTINEILATEDDS